jgi:hypothetical protein
LVGAARRGWARDNRGKLEAYIGGYLAGLAWLYDPANRDEAIAILRRNLPQMSAEVAAQSHAVLVSPRGFEPKAALDSEGIRTVLELRSRYGEPKKQLIDPAKYLDATYYSAAAR